jgi:DNA-binding NtrC family response regulator
MPFKAAKEQLLASFERAYLEALLPRHGGVVSRAAEAAGLSRKHLHDLIRRLGLDADCAADEPEEGAEKTGRGTVVYGNA